MFKFVCIFSINFKTALAKVNIFCLATHMTPGKVYGWLKIKKFDILNHKRAGFLRSLFRIESNYPPSSLKVRPDFVSFSEVIYWLIIPG